MIPREIVLEQINHRETAQAPYTLAFEPEVESRLDHYYGGSSWRDRIMPYIARSKVSGLVNLKAEIFDESHYRDVFGTIWRTDKATRSVVKPGLKKPSLEGYAFPTLERVVDRDAILEAKDLVGKSSESFTIVFAGLCLWECWRLRGFEETLMDSIAEEDYYAELLDRMTELAVKVVAECVDIPADAIMNGDDWGDQRGVTMGPDRWRKFYKPRYARIFEAIHKQGKYTIMHSCGSVVDIIPDLIEIGLDVLESVQPEAAGMNPYDLKKVWGDDITFWGCLGTQDTIPFDSPSGIRREIRRLRNEMGVGGGFILSPAKPLRPDTPTENVVAIVEEFLS